MTNFLKFSFSLPRVLSVGEDTLEAALEAIVESEVAIEFGIMFVCGVVV